MSPRLHLLAVLLLPLTANAWPADVNLYMYAGEERFQPLSAISWVQVEDPSLLSAEVLEGGEVFLTAHKAGRTLVLLYAEGKFAVWRVQVKQEKQHKPLMDAPLKAMDAAGAACPGMKLDGSLEGRVPDEKCRAALLTLLQSDAFVTKQVDLTFEIPALQAQLSSLSAGFAERGWKLKASYLGAGLVLEGTLTPQEHRQALWEVFKRSAGPVALDDRIQLSTDAGTP